MAMGCLAKIHGEAARRGEALRLGAAALALARDAGRLRAADVLNTVADVQHDLGRPGPAAEIHSQAFGIARETSHRYPETEALVCLAACHHRLGRIDRALRYVHQALAIARQAGYQILECRTREVLADIHLARGEAGAAAAEARKADTLHAATGYRRGPRRGHVTAGSPER
jgi:ATP/maltotriose-dependent transcriptional regulator MalT